MMKNMHVAKKKKETGALTLYTHSEYGQWMGKRARSSQRTSVIKA